jgi:NDP-sugar pyrophosphorylase family protein
MIYDFDSENIGVEAYEHPNGGGIVAKTAKVAPGAYIGKGVRVYENAKVDGTCSLTGNVSVHGNAIVSQGSVLEDDVEVTGSAHLIRAIAHGNMFIDKTPVTLHGFEHDITITNTHVVVGCICMEHSEWTERGRAALRANGYPTRSADRIVATINGLVDCYKSIYHPEDMKEALDI